MNFKKFLIEQGIISEAPRSADVDYEEKKNKAGEITEVIATLKQQKASAATKIINDFVEADEEMKKFQDIRDKVRPDLLEKLNALFDLNDELTTRRIKTAKWILTISKKSPKAGTPDKTELDEESFFKEISTLTGMELEAIKALKEKFMKVIKGKPGEGFTEPKITSAVMKEGVSDTLKTWISNVVSMFKTKIIPNIDQKLNSLMKKYKSNSVNESSMKFKRLMKESSMDMLKTKEWLDKMGVKNYTINRDGTVDVDGDVFIEERKLTSIPIQFGVVSGYFDCMDNQLSSLKGAPIKVGRSFYCGNNLLTSLEGCPKIVGRVFNCDSNRLTSLKYGPIKVGGSYSCAYNQLTSLEELPTNFKNSCNGSFICDHNKLTSLKGCPIKIKRNFSCTHNKLTSLKYGPIEVGDDYAYDCSNNPLETIDGLPKNINYLRIKNTRLSLSEIRRISSISNVGKISRNTISSYL